VPGGTPLGRTADSVAAGGTHPRARWAAQDWDSTAGTAIKQMVEECGCSGSARPLAVSLLLLLLPLLAASGGRAAV
jgi:hypothetical protein